MKSIDTCIAYCTRNGLIPRVYDSIEDVCAEYNTQIYGLKMLDPERVIREHRDGNRDPRRIQYSFIYCPVLEIAGTLIGPCLCLLGAFWTLLALIGGLPGIWVSGHVILVGALLIFSPRYVNLSICALVFMGGARFVQVFAAIQPCKGYTLAEALCQLVTHFPYFGSCCLMLYLAHAIFQNRFHVCAVEIRNKTVLVVFDPFLRMPESRQHRFGRANAPVVFPG